MRARHQSEQGARVIYILSGWAQWRATKRTRSQYSIPGKTFAFRPAKSEQIPGIFSAPVTRHCHSVTSRWEQMVESWAGCWRWRENTWWSFVAPPRHSNRPGWERMETLTSASVVERLPATTENISVPSRDTKTQGDTTPLSSGTQHTAKEIKILNLIGGCLSKRDGSRGTCTGQQDKQICWKYSSRRRVLSGHLLPPSLPPSWR